ncbi:hypothetical protein KY084_11490 [Stakelama sp. CBK3Z-3]|uniref:Uncharacterized protein n=1 Tax=Stakelama flava TaxID=2860338 RepID=A0ABS6XMP6_9SPHN|nr:hypothetical protein [Stakelama flava]MBW4331490.1 hypothetical protein [Stakelama flava]
MPPAAVIAEPDADLTSPPMSNDKPNGSISSDITGSETANFVLMELRLGLVSPAFVRQWIGELRGEGFDRLADAMERELNAG